MPVLLSDLNQGQRAGYDGIVSWLIDPGLPIYVLGGSAGTGKSTLMRAFLDNVDKVHETLRLIDPRYRPLELALTATTHPAVDNLSRITEKDAQTIHSFLDLRLQRNYKANTTKLVPKAGAPLKERFLVIVDEASYIDDELMRHLMQRTSECKLLFIGDPYQLCSPRSRHSPVFTRNYPGTELTEIMRQAAGNPIMDWATQLREIVRTGQFHPLKPDGQAIRHVDDATFEQLVVDEFTRPDWQFSDSKLLSYTNERSIQFNNFIQSRLTGDATFKAGDYAVVNAFVQGASFTLKNNETVYISEIEPAQEYGVNGYSILLNGRFLVFMPAHRADKKALLNRLRAEENWTIVKVIEDNWVDLRAAFSCTINKSQGDTFDRVFIDLSDLSRVTTGDMLYRLLYVGVSRARQQVILRGDIIPT